MPSEPIPAPEPGLSAAELIARARDLVPFLRAAAAGMEAERRISDAVNGRILESGLYRMLQPRRFGGYELDLRSFAEAMIELGRGDGSAGWSICFIAAHNLWLTALPEAGQEEMFGSTGDLRCPMVAIPYGTARAVEGGYEVTGGWDYNSGGEIGNWLGVQALLEGERPGEPPRCTVWLFLRRDEYSDHDNWFTTGLRGTGSKRAVIDHVFVPQRRSLDGPAWQSPPFTAPGHGVHANPLYRIPVSPVAGIELVAVALGVTLTAIEDFTRFAGGKRVPNGPGLLADEPRAQLALGHAAAKAEAARAILDRLIERSEARAGRVETGPPFTEAEIRLDGLMWQEAVFLCRDAIDRLCAAAGTYAIRAGSLLERARRDMATMLSHFVMDRDRTAESHGAALLGRPPRNRL